MQATEARQREPGSACLTCRHCVTLRGWTAGAQERGVLNPLPGGEDFVANPALPEDILREAVRLSGLQGCQACVLPKRMCAMAIRYA